MKYPRILVLTVLAAALAPACSDDSGDGGPGAGSGGMAGAAGGGGSGGASAGGGGGSTSNAGAAGSPPLPMPALPADAPTVACPTVINGALEASDRRQTGRHSRVAPVSACGQTKAFPGNAADPSNPHLYDVYRFSNPGSASACFTFTLTYGANAGAGVSDAGAGDAGADAGGDAGLPGSEDAGVDAGPIAVGPAPAKYLTAHRTFYPTDLARDHLGDVGNTLDSPQTMGITVPAGDTVDVVVYAIDVAPAGVGSYTLSCSAQ